MQERNVKETSGLEHAALTAVCSRRRLFRLVRIERFAVPNAGAMVISSREHIHVLVEGASDTFYHVQICNHWVALQHFGYDTRSSPVNDVVLLERRHSCLQRQSGSLVQQGIDHRPCQKVAAAE